MDINASNELIDKKIRDSVNKKMIDQKNTQKKLIYLMK